jgi:hypothetical protein
MLIWRRRTALDAVAILKIQVHRDRDKELADNRRFTLATKIEACLRDAEITLTPKVGFAVYARSSAS